MKKILLTSILSVLGITCFAQTDYMVIEKQDNTKVTMNVEDIKRVTFTDRYNFCPDDNHPHMVDLGLPSGLLWACCNVQAAFPEDFGGLYAWGETEEKSEYTITNYKHAYLDENGTIEDFKTKQTYSYNNIGYDISGTSYDVAHVQWGNGWRMPVGTEAEELMYNCTQVRVQRNGVYGILFTGSNGNSIFFPTEKQDKSYESYWLGDTFDWIGWGETDKYDSGGILSPGVWHDGAWDYGVMTWMGTERRVENAIRPVKGTKLAVITGEATNITDDGATLNVTIQGNFPPGTHFYVEYGEDEPKYAREASTISGNTYSVTLRYENPNTTYYYRAFAQVGELSDGGYQYYGEVKSFTTKSLTVCPVANAVDLGLSVKWASWNMGATSPEELGYQYAYGETEPKETYTKENYRNDPEMIMTGDVIAGGNSCDVATNKWGEGWRMPLVSETRELISKCTITRTTLNGVSVAKVTGPNGNYIYMPFETIDKDTKRILLWTGTNYGKDVLGYPCGYSLYVYYNLLNGDMTKRGDNYSTIWYGLYVRPVKKY